MKKKTKNILLGLVILGVGVTWFVALSTKKSAANMDATCYTYALRCSGSCNMGAWNPDTHTRSCSAEYESYVANTYRCWTSRTVNPYVKNPSVRRQVVVGEKCTTGFKGIPSCQPVYGMQAVTLEGYYYNSCITEDLDPKGLLSSASGADESCYSRVSDDFCSVYEETDLVEPVCNFQTVNAGTQLQFMCTKGTGGVADCQNYTEWTDIDFAQPNEAKILGVASEAGVYKGCVVPTE